MGAVPGLLINATCVHREPRGPPTRGVRWDDGLGPHQRGQAPHVVQPKRPPRSSARRSVPNSYVPERVVMRLSGHKTPSVCARYDIVSDGDLDHAVTLLAAVAHRAQTSNK